MSYRAIVGASAGLLLAVTSVAITSAGSSREAGAPAPAGGGYSSGGGGGPSVNERGGGGASFGRGGEDHSIGLGDGRSFGGGGVRSFEGTGSRGASSASGGDPTMHDPWHVGKPSAGLHSPRISPGEVGHGAVDDGDRVAHSNGALPNRRSEPPAKSMRQNATVHEQAQAGNAHRFVRRHFGGRVGEHNQLPARYRRGEGAIGWMGGVFWPDAFYDLLEYAFGPYDADYPGDQRSDPDEAGAQACGREASGALDLPFDWIHRTLHLSTDQQAKLEDLKIAASSGRPRA
jgi:hypothetical protein